jgi:AraC-like DNA-binding protein
MHLVFRLEGPPLRLFTDDDPHGQRFEPAIVGGARSSAYVKDISEPAGSVGVELWPGAAEVLLGVPAGELAERHTALSAVLGAEVQAMHARLLEAPGPEARLDLLEAFLRARLSTRRAVHPAIAGALARFAHSADVGAAVRESGYSHRHFVALFRASVGLAPKLYCRVRRFQAVIAAASSARLDWADLALDAGYADQPHLHRDFRDFLGLSPAVYRALAAPGSRHVPLPGQILPRRPAIGAPR